MRLRRDHEDRLTSPHSVHDESRNRGAEILLGLVELDVVARRPVLHRKRNGRDIAVQLDERDCWLTHLSFKLSG